MTFPQTFTKGNKTIYSVIETPHGSRNKYTYNKENDFFELTKVLPSGTSFPLDFGFIPHTLGEDGDPLDVLVISDFPTFPGCVVQARVIGVIEAIQKEKKEKAVRNDRLIAVASESLCYSHLEEIADMNENHLNEVIHFFKYYNQMVGKKFKVIKTRNSVAAMRLIQKNVDDKK